MSTPALHNVRALFADLDIPAKAEDVSVDLVIDRFDQWADNGAFCAPSVTRIVWGEHPEAA